MRNHNYEMKILNDMLEVFDDEEYAEDEWIYHYTSPQGLLGILSQSSPKLWFSRYDALNDASEGNHIVEMYQTVCNELRKNGKISEEFYQAVSNVYPDSTDYFSFASPNAESFPCVTHEEIEEYVCCFSLKRDSLPMWNYYSKNGKYEGYNIAFDELSLRNECFNTSRDNGYSLSLHRVIYDEDTKRKKLEGVILEFYRNISKADPNKERDPDFKSSCFLFSQMLRKWHLWFKPTCFCHEQEVRAILTLPRNRKADVFPTQYRNVDGYIVPYVECSFSNETVKGITIGPLLNDEVAKNMVHILLQDKGYYINDIQNSKIPIRY